MAQDLLRVAAGYRNGLAKLIPEKDVQRFADSYVSTSVLAGRFRLNSGSLALHLKESGTPLLAIPNPDVGKGHAYFLRRMLRPRCGFQAPRSCGRRHSAVLLPGKGSGQNTGGPRRRLCVDPCDESVRIVVKWRGIEMTSKLRNRFLLVRCGRVILPSWCPVEPGAASPTLGVSEEQFAPSELRPFAAWQSHSSWWCRTPGYFSR